MMAFDAVFYDVARNESRAIHAFDRAGHQQTFLFREFYCNDPGCDCRRVVLQVQWVEGKRVAASINYAFEPSRRRDEPQFFLDPMNPQTSMSKDLLDIFAEMVTGDATYRSSLVSHYTMWKRVVDDPRHLDHPKVRGAAHEDRAFRPAFPSRKPRAKRPPRQPAQASAPAPVQGIQRLARTGARSDSKVQQRFARLIKKVDQRKQRLRTWRDAQPAIHRAVGAYAALVESHQRAGHDLVCLFDRVYPNPIFSKADRRQLRAAICEISGDLLAEGGHEDLKAIYNRHSQSDFDSERAAADAAGAGAMKAALEEMFAMDFGDDEVSSLDELRERVEAQLRDDPTSAPDTAGTRDPRRTTPPGRKKSVKQLAKDAAREAEHVKVGKTLQEIYRKLAIALHPDLEQDPGERARKTELMQRVNVAYEAKDLLQLLELQLQFEQVDPAKVDAIAEDRLRHYNTILDDQAKQLDAELADLELPFRIDLDLPPSTRLSPDHVIAKLRVTTDELKERSALLQRDLDAFRDVKQLKAWLRSFARSRPADSGLFG